jgi:hypothetical protein
MAQTSDHWAELVDPRMREAFYLGFSGGDRRTSMIPRLFGVRSTQLANEKVLGIGGIGSSGWNFEDTGRVIYDEPTKGFEETFTPHEFAHGIVVERKLIDDNRISEALDASGNLGDSAFRVREKAAANVFINAFSSATSETLDDYGTDTVGADSVALCSDAHDTSPQNGDNLTNEGTLSLTEANVSTTRQLHMAQVDMNGDLLNIMPDEILVPPELEDTALKILRSTQESASANNAINPQAGRFQVIVWHYLTDANSWFMLDSGLRRQHLRWYDRIPLEFGREQDFDTFAAKWRAYMRFTLGWTDWRFVYGQNPS